MATAPGISTPGVGRYGDIGGLGRLAGRIRSDRAAREREERKRREIFEKMALENDVNDAVRARLAELPEGATPVERYQAIEEAGLAIATGYGDQDPTKGEQAQKHLEKIWLGPHRTKAETYQNKVNDERLKGEYANTIRELRLGRAAALREWAGAETEDERNAAFVKYQTISESATEYVRMADPYVAGEQLAEWNAQDPLDVMTTFEGIYHRDGRLTELQSGIRRGDFKQFMSRMTPDARKEFEQGLSKRIGAEALTRKRLLDAEKAAEAARQARLVEKYSDRRLTFLDDGQLRASMRADGATSSTIGDVLANREKDATNIDKFNTRAGRGGIVAESNAWLDGQVFGSEAEVQAALVENDRRWRTGRYGDSEDVYKNVQNELENRRKLVKLLGEERATEYKNVFDRLKLEYGLRETPAPWSHEVNAQAALFRESYDAAVDFAAANGLGASDLEDVVRMMVLNAVAEGRFDYDRTRMRGVALDPELDAEQKELQRKQLAATASQRLLNVIKSKVEGKPDAAQDVHNLLVASGPDRTPVPMPKPVYEDGVYSQDGTMGAIQMDPDLDEGGKARAFAAHDSIARLAGMVAGHPDFKTVAQQKKEAQDAKDLAAAQEELEARQAAEAQAESERLSQQVGPERAGPAPWSRPRGRRTAQTFARPDQPIDVQEMVETRAGQTRELVERSTQRISETQQRLRDRIRGRDAMERPRPRGRGGQMGRRRRRR